MAAAEMGNYSDLAAQDLERADRSRQQSITLQMGSDFRETAWNMQLSGSDAVHLTQQNGRGDLTYRFDENGPQLQHGFSTAPEGHTLESYAHTSALYKVWNVSCGLAARAPDEQGIEAASRYSNEAAKVYHQSRMMSRQYCMPHIGMKLASLR